jgi:peptidoglycan-associated lipoprotein
MRIENTAIGFGAILLTLSACGAEATAPPRTPAEAARSAKADGDTRSPSKSTVHIAEDIRKTCGIADSDAHFAFDSAKVADDERRVLRSLAQCFVSGPLAGRDMRLVGHTDPRGEVEYNFALGGRRADNVKGVLVNQGLPAERAASTSRGEIDARGSDETSWTEDRRVDVMLAP